MDDDKEIEEIKKDNGSIGVVCNIPKELEPFIQFVKFKYSIKTKSDAVVFILKSYLETEEGKELVGMYDKIKVGGANDDRAP